jgi:hypothetical protein
MKTLMIDASLEPNRLVIKHPLKDESRNEVKFISDPSNQFIWRGIFLVRDLLFDMMEEKNQTVPDTESRSDGE